MPLTFKQAMSELKKAGSAGTKKIYLRHGASEPLFGVKFGDLTKLKKKIGTNHELAAELWKTGNCDAQTLALMVVDSSKLKSSDIDAWIKPLRYDLLIGMLGGVIAQTKFASAKWKKWHKSKTEWTLVAAYTLLSSWLKEDSDCVPEEFIETALEKISSSIHQSPNLARHAMNNALIAIGVYREDYRKEVLSICKSVGKVNVDHGETSCTTPDAASYIKKSVRSGKKRTRC